MHFQDPFVDFHECTPSNTGVGEALGVFCLRLRLAPPQQTHVSRKDISRMGAKCLHRPMHTFSCPRARSHAVLAAFFSALPADGQATRQADGVRGGGRDRLVG